MSQKSILSFFKAASEKTNGKETKRKSVIVDDSPVKKPKRKVQHIDSDDESSDTAIKLNGECNKASETYDKTEESSGQSSKKVKNSVTKINGNISLRNPSEEQKKIENDEKGNSSQSPRKDETGTSSHTDELSKENDTHADSPDKIEDKPSCSKENGVSDFIPKRKTARKQMSSARNIKRNNVKQVKEEYESKTANDEVRNNSMSTSNGNIEHEGTECKTEIANDTLSTSGRSENIEEDLENGKSSEVSKTSANERKASSAFKDKGSPSKKPKKESVHAFSSEVSKMSANKRKANSAFKDKGSPSKKPKKESLHSFFTPLKKAEDKHEEEIKKKSLQAEKDDSPVKKVKQKKRLQCLESDDEEVTTVKKEEEDNEFTNSHKSQENETAEKSPENAASEVKQLSPKKPASDKKDSEKQKFGIKSTSAVDTVYDPSKSHYHPIEDAFWKQNEKVPYLALAKTLELIENTSGRLKTIEILSNFFRSVIVLSPCDLLHSIYLCLNRVAPEYEGIEMGVGETLLMKAVAQATGRTLEKIKAEVAIKGDLGLVSESSRGHQQVMFAPPKLTVSAVFNKFLEIAKMSGNAAMAKKTDKIKTLFVACRDCEAKYIIRSLSGKLRIGLAEQSVLSAVARAAVLTPPGQAYPPAIIDASKKKESFKEFLDSQTLILKTAYCECPSYDLIIPVLLKEGISALPDRCQLSPGVPLKPMLAHPTAGIDKVLERFDKNAFTCEFKYDGERAQIHMNDKGEVKIFSRNQEDNTSKYPDIISRLPNAVKESTKSFILDSEAVAYDRETKQILPFQVLSTRKRKDAVESEIVVQVCVMAFDLLYLNGESLVKKPLKERRALLHSSFIEVENQFMFAQYKDGDSAETMQEFLDESVKGNCEGLMVKSLEVDASYEIAKRSHNWLKLKKDYLQGIGDTLDLVVIGGYYGKGKRTSNYGGFLLACYDKESEEFQSICKLGTGFKDHDLETHTKFFKQHIISEPKPYYRYDHSLEPDDWFDTVQVWEIKCADLSISPVHRAAIGIIDPAKGISLRFPRFIRIRDDKSPEDATSSTQIAEMYESQQQIQNMAGINSKVEEDYY